MIEQYIYSRSETSFTNARGQNIGLGFGFVALSPQMNALLKEDVLSHCSTCPKIAQLDAQGRRLPVFRKVRLAKSGWILLQTARWIEEPGMRPFHVAHGYTIDPQSPEVTNVIRWFTLPYQLEDPNKTEGGILLDSLQSLTAGGGFSLHELATVMQRLELDPAQFSQMLLACFDALIGHRQVLIAYDFSAPDAQALQGEILYWLLLCLPYALRIELGIDGVYNESSAPRLIQIAFVDQNAIAGDKSPTIRVGDQTVPLGGNFLLRGGKVLHNEKYATKWYGKDCLYAQCLTGVVEAIWERDPRSGIALASALNKFYGELHKQLPEASEAGGLDPQLYSAVCKLLAGTAAPELAVIFHPLLAALSKEEGRGLDLLYFSRMGSGADDGLIQNALRELAQQHRTPADQKDLELLAAMRGGKMEREAMAILLSYLSADLDAVGEDTQAVCQRYTSLLPEEAGAELLHGAFFGPSGTEQERALRGGGVPFDEEALRRRRRQWYQGKLSACRKARDIPSCIEKSFTGAGAPPPADKGAMLEEMARFAREERLEQMAPSPTMREVLALVRGAEPYRSTPQWKSYAGMASDLTGRCKLEPGECGVEALEELQNCFAPYVPELADCWEKLFQMQCAVIAKRKPMFQIDERLTGRLEAIERGLPGSFPLTLRELPGKMRESVYQELLREPRPFMTGAWLREESDKLPTESKSAVILRTLADLAAHKRKDVELWVKLISKPGRAKDLRFETFEVLRKLYLAGAVPGVEGSIVIRFLHESPAQAKEILMQAAAQGGRELLLSLVERAAKYERRLEGSAGTDLGVILWTLGQEPKLLDLAAEHERGSLQTDEDLILLLEELVKRQGISPNRAAQAASGIYKHYENGGGPVKPNVKRAVAKLNKGS